MSEAALGFRFVLAGIFLLAGLAKLPRLAEFEAAVRCGGRGHLDLHRVISQQQKMIVFVSRSADPS